MIRTRALELVAPEVFEHPIVGKRGAPIVVVCDPQNKDAARTKAPLSHKNLMAFAAAAKTAGLGRDDFVFVGLCPPIAEQDVHSASRKWAHVQKYEETVKGHIEALGPRCIVPLGELASRVVMGRAVAITKSRGTPIVKDNRMILPMLSPGYILYQPEHQPTFNADMLTLARLKKQDFVFTEADDNTTGYEWCTDLSFLLENRPTIIGLDTETTGLTWHDPTVKVLTVQIAWAPGKAVAIPVDPTYWPAWQTAGRQRAKLYAQLKELLEDPEVLKVGHNLKFDVHMLRKMSIEVQGWCEDTQLMAFAIDENMMQKSLDECVRRWVPSMAGYADKFNTTVDKAQMIKVPHDVMLPYAAGDADASLRLFRVLHDALRMDRQQYTIYRRILIPAITTFCNNVERVGMLIDQDRLREFEKEVSDWLDEEYKALIAMVPAVIRRNQIEDGKELKFSRPAFVKEILFTQAGFNLTPVVFTKSTAALEPQLREPSTSAKDHLPYFFERDDAAGEFVRRLADFQKTQKLLGTYLRGFWKYIAPNGRIYPSYKLHGTVTGRTACVHADTMIRCETGFKRAEEVMVGDRVWTHRLRWQTVTQLYRKPVQEMYHVKFDSGEFLRCTEEHRLLTEDGRWVSLRHVCIEETLGRPEREDEGSRSLSTILGDYDAVGEGRRVNRSHGDGNSSTRDRTRNPSSVEGTEIFGIQAGREEPDAGQDPFECEGGLRGWTRLLDTGRPWQTVFRASDCDGGNARTSGGTTTAELGRSPHRREPAEQRTRQSGVDDSHGASGTSSALCEVGAGVRIARVVPCGSHPVYDFEVAVDHSYEAAGCFSHNSDNPNGQNFPKRGRWAKAYSRIFKATPGYKLINCDLSQIELRLAAWMANDKMMLRIYRSGGDIHTATAKSVNRMTDAQWDALSSKERKELRTKAKAVNFGFLYGMWWKKFMGFAKTEYGVTYTPKEAEQTRELFFQTYRQLEEWHSTTREFVNENGFVRSLHGAIRHLPSIYSDDDKVRQGAERQAINSPVQRFGSDLGLIAMVRYSMQADPDKFRIIGFVHDALVMEVKDGYEKEGIESLLWCMQNVPLKPWFGIEPPIPIIAEADIGLNGGEMLEFADLPEPDKRPEWFTALGFDSVTPTKPDWWRDELEREADALTHRRVRMLQL